MTYYSLIPLVSVITKITIIFGQGFRTRVLGKFSVSFAKITKTETPVYFRVSFGHRNSGKVDFRERQNNKNFRPMHCLIRLTKRHFCFTVRNSKFTALLFISLLKIHLFKSFSYVNIFVFNKNCSVFMISK